MIDNREYEKKLEIDGIEVIAGVDEVGRGPLIGNVVAACVVLPVDFELEGLTDSKKLSEKKRNETAKNSSGESVEKSIMIEAPTTPPPSCGYTIITPSTSSPKSGKLRGPGLSIAEK